MYTEIHRGVVATDTETESYLLRVEGTLSEALEKAAEVFGELETYGGGWTDVNRQFLARGVTQLHIIAWVASPFAGLLPEDLNR